MNIKELLDEIEIDRTKDYLLSLRKFQQDRLVIPFNVDNIKYEFVIVETIIPSGEKVSTIVFKNMTAANILKKDKEETENSFIARTRDAKIGLTNTGKNMRVFNTVFNILASYLEKYKPNYLHYFAVENNRKKLYNKILERLQNRINIQLVPLSTSLISNELPKSNEFCFKIK